MFGTTFFNSYLIVHLVLYLQLNVSAFYLYYVPHGNIISVKNVIIDELNENFMNIHKI